MLNNDYEKINTFIEINRLFSHKTPLRVHLEEKETLETVPKVRLERKAHLGMLKENQVHLVLKENQELRGNLESRVCLERTTMFLDLKDLLEMMDLREKRDPRDLVVNLDNLVSKNCYL